MEETLSARRKAAEAEEDFVEEELWEGIGTMAAWWFEGRLRVVPDGKRMLTPAPAPALVPVPACGEEAVCG